MGIKTVLNELIAYLELANCRRRARSRSRLIMLYAMCGFANFGSPRHHDRRARHRDGAGTARRIISLGGKSIVSGTLTTCLMGAIVGVLKLMPAACVTTGYAASSTVRNSAGRMTSSNSQLSE